MSDARLAADVEVGALRRIAESRGGSATVVRKGDRERGQILICLHERSRYATFVERALAEGGEYRWQKAGPAREDAGDIDSFVQRRLRSDPDLWLIDLDIADSERFIVEISGSG